MATFEKERRAPWEQRSFNFIISELVHFMLAPWVSLKTSRRITQFSQD
jgi:hypothetical protein